ncbi:DUF3618 domain-containing protein [Modestobacter sp. VKM Ac-2985]|uniref:DUF3618 domain-containing protein n=1 Tax=Modestobacter sp. VKM Ac-2985 TaxID=3004139 RepID=UPI0022AB9B78|nr:DUF3618 domain-containing protein [Modestobacter sp. VKM Ac-2985]MCZ2837263.1 DUF3618 domain-containing protein [Modestobacter sp. VKM Ac-2985]
MTGPDDRTSGGKPDPDAIRADIEQTREQLGRTVDELSHRLDVPARAQERVDQAKSSALESANRTKDTAVETYRENPPAVIGGGVAALTALVGLLAWRRKRRQTAAERAAAKEAARRRAAAQKAAKRAGKERAAARTKAAKRAEARRKAAVASLSARTRSTTKQLSAAERAASKQLSATQQAAAARLRAGERVAVKRVSATQRAAGRRLPRRRSGWRRTLAQLTR